LATDGIDGYKMQGVFQPANGGLNKGIFQFTLKNIPIGMFLLTNQNDFCQLALSKLVYRLLKLLAT